VRAESDPAVLSRVANWGELRCEWSGMSAFAEIAGVPSPPSASGTGMGQRDFPAVPEARHGLQRDGGALLRCVFPPDSQELWWWRRLHRFTPAAESG
jgi:hypothetical protein